MIMIPLYAAARKSPKSPATGDRAPNGPDALACLFMSHFAVHYSYATDAESLTAHRPAHRTFLRSLLDSGLLAAGAYPEAKAPGALLIIEAASEETVAALLDDDPFFVQGLIKERRIQLWNPPIGIFA